EMIASGWNAVEAGGSLIAGLDPAIVEPDEPISKSDLFGLDEAGRRVANLEGSGVRWNPDFPKKINRPSGQAELFDDRVWRFAPGREGARIDDRPAAHRGEPQSSVRGPDACGLTAAVDLDAREAVARSQHDGRDRAALALGDFIQLATTDARNASIRSHPEI